MKSTFKRNLSIGFGLSLTILVLSTFASYLSIHNLLENSKLVNNTNLVIQQLENFISTLKDAETGQRGYLLTGEEEFLQPYTGAYDRALNTINYVSDLTKENPEQQEDCHRLSEIIIKRMSQLQYLIDMKRANELITNAQLKKGKEYMDGARKLVSTMEDREKRYLAVRTAAMNRFAGYTPILIVVAALLAVVITVVFFFRVKKDYDEREQLQKDLKRKDEDLIKRINIIQEIADKIAEGNYEIRVNDENKDALGSLADSLNTMAGSLQYSFDLLRDKEWLQAGLAKLNEKMIGEQDLKTLTPEIIEFICSYTNCAAGAFYLAQEDNILSFSAGYAYLPAPGRTNIKSGEGLVGQCVVSRKILTITGISPDQVSVTFGGGEIKPAQVIAIPVFHEKKLKGVIELASTKEFSKTAFAFFEAIPQMIGIVVHSAISRERLQEVLEETQAQAEELQSQHRELEALNADLEMQTQKLQTSEEELRVQQEELLQANQELEERTRVLEEKNQLIRERNREIQSKAEELELSTKYKSEFLANMSHELRTPLNSILLLSGLMADNSGMNLNEEQVEYARVIQSSGSGLLALIDEILDLSKIESGKMELDFETLKIEEVAGSMKDLFVPVARQHNIEFAVNMTPGTPVTIKTDRMRLEQILKNLLSNALKFTPKNGTVSLNISKAQHEDIVIFSVKDTGIGIPPDKQQLIFEAFQQADGSTRRKYGGTGLGLSISRELAKLLGGEINLTSEVDKGSEFRISIPLAPAPVNFAQTESGIELNESKNLKEQGIPEMPRYNQLLAAPKEILDDRDSINAGDRCILIIEDDTNFAKLLLDFTRRNGYKGVVALRGDQGLELAKTYKPLGILLDLQLPVRNGWDVMKDLKNDPQTRHIPVHTMSSMEARKESLLNGAVDFINKPVALEKIKDVFVKIEHLLSRNPKKVLIVEENAKHAQALGYFLESSHVSAEIKDNVEDSIKTLLDREVNCVILDMGVPDQQSHDVLERIKKTPGLENLPVIIFTGKSLSKSEELRIKKYADSIVVKTAHSYQRILDEVSLFLHIVEENVPQKANGQFKKLGALGEVLKNKIVLIADDDVRNIYSLTKALEAYSMKVISALDGNDALRLLQENPSIDIILMDMMMPERDGYETTIEIRRNPTLRNIPVIAVTAKAMTGDREKCISAGASDYITKPVDIDQLLSLLRVWLYEN